MPSDNRPRAVSDKVLGYAGLVCLARTGPFSRHGVFARKVIPRQKKKRSPKKQRSAYLNVFSTGTFLALRFVERNLLAFSQIIKATAFDTGRVKKQILFATNVNKAKTLVRNSLDCTFSHLFISQKKVLRRCREHKVPGCSATSVPPS